MAISEKRAKELAELEPPRSIERIVRFAAELGEKLRASGAPEEQTFAPGGIGARSSEFAERIAQPKRELLGGVSVGDFRGMVRRNAITGSEIQDFARWLSRWNEKRTSIESIRVPDAIFANTAVASLAAPSWEAGSVSEMARRRIVRVERPVDIIEEEVVEVVSRKKRTRQVTREVDAPEEPGAATPWEEARKPRFQPKAEVRKVEVEVAERQAAPAQPEPSRLDPRLIARGAGRAIWTSNLGLGGFVAGSLLAGQTHSAMAMGYPGPAGAVHAMSLVQPGMISPPGLAPLSLGAPPTFPTPSFEAPGLAPELMGGAVRPSVDGYYASALGSATGADASGQGIGMQGAVAPSFLFGAGPDSTAPPPPILIARLPGGTPIYLPSGVASALRARYGLPPPSAAPAPLSPFMGQVTVAAPSMRVASPAMHARGASVAFDWQKLAGGIGEVDAGGWAQLKSTLPPGSQILYPALPPGSLGPNSANLRLSQPLLENLLQAGYGTGAVPLAGPAVAMAAGHAMTSPISVSLQGSIVPEMRPAGATPGILADDASASKPGGALAHAGLAQAQRGTVLDFLGMPVRLAPSLSGRPDLADELAVRSAMPEGAAAVMKPQEFASMRTRLFPKFQSVETETDKSAWRKAGPDFGLRSDRPSTLLSPDSRVKVPSSTAPLPQIEGGRGAVSDTLRSLKDLGKPASGLEMPSETSAASIGGPVSDIGSNEDIKFPATSSAQTTPPMPLAPRPSGAPAGAATYGPTPAAAGSGSPTTVGGAPPVVPGSSPAVPSDTQSQAAKQGGQTPFPLSTPFLGSLPATAGPIPSPTPGFFPSLTVPPPLAGQVATRAAWSPAPAPMFSLPASPTPTPASKPGTLAHPAVSGAPAIPTRLPARRTARPQSSGGMFPAVQSPISETPSTPAFPSMGGSSSPSMDLPAIGGAPTGPTLGRASTIRSAPDRLLPSLPELNKRAGPPLAIQRADSSTASTANPNQGAQQSARSVAASSSEGGNEAAEVGLLANEVWSLIRRRILDELDRGGRW